MKSILLYNIDYHAAFVVACSQSSKFSSFISSCAFLNSLVIRSSVCKTGEIIFQNSFISESIEYLTSFYKNIRVNKGFPFLTGCTFKKDRLSIKIRAQFYSYNLQRNWFRFNLLLNIQILFWRIHY